MFTQAILLYEIFVAGIFLIWLIATVICQFEEWKITSAIRTFDPLNLIPLWTFFAPNPGKQDYHLLYRDKEPGGTIGDWVEVDMHEERYLFSFIWNPDKRDKKVLSDIVQDLIVTIRSDNGERNKKYLIVTLPYLAVLKVVCTKERTSVKTAYRQFMLAGSHGFKSTEAPEFILLSMFHPL